MEQLREGGQRQTRVAGGVVVAALAEVGVGRAGQGMHQAGVVHADESLDGALVPRHAGRVRIEGDAQLAARVLQVAADELAAVVRDQLLGQAPHRPVVVGTVQLVRVGLREDTVQQAAHDGAIARGLEADEQAEGHPAVHVDRQSQRGAADGQPVFLVDEEQVEQGVVDLDAL